MLYFASRWLFAFVLLTVTYNPTPYSYIGWVALGSYSPLSLMVLSGLILCVGYVIYIRATMRSIGVGGMALVIALISAVIWVLYDLGALSFANQATNTWVALVAGSLVLGVGLSWSHVRRRLSGQIDVDEVDED